MMHARLMNMEDAIQCDNTRAQPWVRRTGLMVCALTALLVCCRCDAAAQMHGASDSTLNAIRTLYEKGSYLTTELEARRYLEQQSLSDSLRVAAERYLAFALVAQGKGNAAVRHFTTILEIDSTFDLDPVFTSPKILASFNEAKQFWHSQQSSDATIPAGMKLSTIPGVSWRSLVFPGWEQLHQGRDLKGYILLSAGAATIGVTIALEVIRSNAKTDYLAATTPAQAATLYTRYNNAYKAQVYSIFTFAAVYLYSEIDAFLGLPRSQALSLQPEPSGIRLAIHF
jgi:hypothetical protein